VTNFVSFKHPGLRIQELAISLPAPETIETNFLPIDIVPKQSIDIMLVTWLSASTDIKARYPINMRGENS